MNQNSEHINQNSTLRWNKTSTQHQLWNAGATEVQQLNPDGPNQRQITNPSQLNLKFYAGAIIKSEDQPTGVQLKRSAKLLTVTGLTTKHAVCRITFMLYPVLLYRIGLLHLSTEKPKSELVESIVQSVSIIS